MQFKDIQYRYEEAERLLHLAIKDDERDRDNVKTYKPWYEVEDGYLNIIGCEELIYLDDILFTYMKKQGGEPYIAGNKSIDGNVWTYAGYYYFPVIDYNLTHIAVVLKRSKREVIVKCNRHHTEIVMRTIEECQKSLDLTKNISTK